jgi:hypothetical protein
MKERPAGITLTAALFLALGVLSLLWGGLVLGIGGLSALFGNLFGAENMTSFGQASAWSGYFGIITAIVQIVVGFGLLGMYRWAWILSLVGLALTVILGVIGMVSGGTFGFICGSLGLIFPVILLVYLLSKNIRNAFGVGAR